jgi:Tfp pilus assembly protein PilP
MKYLFSIAIIILLMAAVFINNIHAQTIITKKVGEKELFGVKIFTKEHHVPPVYDPKGKIDPFKPIEEYNTMAQSESIVVAKKPAVPETPLTKWSLAQLRLTSVMIGEKFCWAFFETPDGGRVYKGVVGDYLGKDGLTIKNINVKGIVLSDDKAINVYNY